MFGPSSGEIVGIIIGIIAGIVIIFLICREIVCWYWKLNKIVELMEEQNNLLKRQIGLTYNNVIQNNTSTVDDWVCKKCNHTNRKTALFCNSCGEKK